MSTFSRASLYRRTNRQRTWFLRALLLVFFSVAGQSVSSVAAADNPIVVENQHPGSGDWDMWLHGFAPANDVSQQIKGYASATSVNKGDSITFSVTVNPAQNYTMDVYRMGWYQGLGGRLLQHIGPLSGFQQPACPVAATTGLIECNWTPSYTLAVPTTWTSGVFLVQLTNAEGYQNYITFVVRDDASSADLLYQASVNTYQAYNNFPNDATTGKSLYGYNSFGADTISGESRAVKVSFNRPYANYGAGQFLDYEMYFIRWLERNGYDASYTTDLDTHEHAARLLTHKAFLSVGHDEYWSKAMYDGVEQARNAGIHLGFFGANTAYWQVRFEASPLTGAPDRVMVGYKDVATDPVQGPTTTTLWRDPFLNRAEQRLVGVQYVGGLMGQPPVPFVAANTSHWVYEGTGMADGDSVPGIEGVEVDSSQSDSPLPTSVIGTYTLLSQSPVLSSNGQVSANTSIYQAPSGAWVFGAGSITWSQGLDLPGVVDPRIEQITANVLDRFVGDHTPPVITVPSDMVVDTSSAAGAHVVFSASAFDAVSGSLQSTCQPSSNSLFSIGSTTVTCTATDAAGNVGTGTFKVTVRLVIPPPAPDGRMYGVGFVNGSGVHQHFVFRVSQVGARDYGRLEFWANDPRRCVGDDDDDDHGDRDGDHDRDYGREHCRITNRFDATSIAAADFSDDPAFQPGRRNNDREPSVDSVTFKGAGKWNGKSGYTFEASATDKGEPGRNRDTFALVVKDSHGAVVANLSGVLGGGNNQSTRLRR